MVFSLSLGPHMYMHKGGGGGRGTFENAGDCVSQHQNFLMPPVIQIYGHYHILLIDIFILKETQSAAATHLYSCICSGRQTG